MTASLYQSGSSTSSPDGVAGSFAEDCATSFIVQSLGSHKVVEVMLGAHVPAQLEDMRGQALRIERDVVARPAPLIALPAQKIVDLIGLAGIEAESAEVQLDPAGLY